MNREQKTAEIETLKANFAKAQLVMLADYKGLKVNEFNELRRRLREKDSQMKVVKNRLAKLAIKGSMLESLSSHFVGTTVVTFSSQDPSGPAKVLVDFMKDREAMKIKAATMSGKMITPEQVKALASLPGKEELMAKLLGSMLTPARKWVNVLSQIPRQWVNVLVAVKDKKGYGHGMPCPYS